MSTFWDSRTGAPVTGDEASSFSSNFISLPDNTVASAVIKSAMLSEYNGEKFYSIIWEMVDGEFKGSQVKQRINPYDEKDVRAQRALNMLMRLFKLCEIKLTHSNEPQNEDLAPMKGQIFCIKAGNGIIEGEDRTWVREVHLEGTLPTETGKKIHVATHAPTHKDDEQIPGKVDSALSRNAARTKAAEPLEDDIPF